jgi:hypothetical protein
MIQSKHDQAQLDILTGRCLEVNRRRMKTYRYVDIGDGVSSRHAVAPTITLPMSDHRGPEAAR